MNQIGSSPNHHRRPLSILLQLPSHHPCIIEKARRTRISPPSNPSDLNPSELKTTRRTRKLRPSNPSDFVPTRKRQRTVARSLGDASRRFALQRLVCFDMIGVSHLLSLFHPSSPPHRSQRRAISPHLRRLTNLTSTIPTRLPSRRKSRVPLP